MTYHHNGKSGFPNEFNILKKFLVKTEITTGALGQRVLKNQSKESLYGEFPFQLQRTENACKRV